MKKDEIIALLQQQISFLQEQLQEANRKANALLEEVTSLRNMLEHKSEEEARQEHQEPCPKRTRRAVYTSAHGISS